MFHLRVHDDTPLFDVPRAMLAVRPPPLRILSLDGGGSWALIQVKCLIEMYTRNGAAADGALVRGHRVLHDFDIVVANSGGSIVAAALFKNMTLGSILRQFRTPTELQRLFQRNPRALRGANALAARWSAAKKMQGLREVLNRQPDDDELRAGPPRFRAPFTDQTIWKVAKPVLNAYGDPVTPAPPPRLVDFGDLRLADLVADAGLPANWAGRHVQLLIVAFDYDTKKIKVFRSNERSAVNLCASTCLAEATTIAQAVHASSTAPIRYFDNPAIFHNASGQTEHYWDGAAVGQNNPLLVGIAEARGLCRLSMSDLRVLSIGTGTKYLPLRPCHMTKREVHDKGALFTPRRKWYDPTADLNVLAQAVVGNMPESASFIAHMWIDGRLPPVTVGGGMSAAPTGAAAAMSPPATPPPLDTCGRLSRIPSQVIRMNPILQPEFDVGSTFASPTAWNDAANWDYPACFTDPTDPKRDRERKRLFKYLAALDLDVVDAEGIAAIEELADLWIAGRAANQPIRNDSCTFEPLIGHVSFDEAYAAWTELVRPY